MGRPKEANISDWGYWKRNQRASKGGKVGKKKCTFCGKVADGAIDHIDNNQANNKSSNKRFLCKSCHGRKTQLTDLALKRKAG